jgi:hypothetical protein
MWRNASINLEKKIVNPKKATFVSPSINYKRIFISFMYENKFTHGLLILIVF